jgi:hypothetical protein
MLLGVMLLYVGAVLCINGIWLIGGTRSETSPLYLQAREVSVINVFTGLVGLVTSIILLAQGNANGEIATIAGGGFILLFAFTYLWVALNNFLNAGGRAFGWYCAFVALTAIPAGILTLQDANGNDASVYLGIDWLAWSVLWGLFFVLLALDRPIARVTGSVAIIEGIGTAWVFGFLLLENKLSF